MVPYPDWLNPGDNAWQLVAATLVGLMSIPGIAVLYGGLVQKKWAVNTMLMAFTGFSLVLVVWVLWGFKMGFGQPAEARPRHPAGRRRDSAHDPEQQQPANRLDPAARRHHAVLPLLGDHAGLLPVRVRRDHSAAVPRQRDRPDQLQGVADLRAAVVDVRLLGQRVPVVGRRLVGTGGRPGLLRWLRDPPGRRNNRIRGCRGDRSAAGAGPGTRGAQQPAPGRGRCRRPVAGLERIQRR